MFDNYETPRPRGLLLLGRHAFGLRGRTSCPERTQGIASFRSQRESNGLATIVKLCRMMLLAPRVFAPAWTQSAQRPRPKHDADPASMPRFILGRALTNGIKHPVRIPNRARFRIITATFERSRASAAVHRKLQQPAWPGSLAFLLIVAGFSLALIS